VTPEVWRARRRLLALDLAGIAVVIACAVFVAGYTLGDHDGRKSAQRERVEHRDFAPARSISSLTWSGVEQVAPLATLTVDDSLDLSAHGADCNVEIRDGRGAIIGTTLAACSSWSGTWTISNFTPADKR
jgi:hypothetical protein